MEDANANHKNARELRSALQYAIIQICAHDDRRMGLQTSPQAIQALAELAFQYSQLVAADLDAFSNHANRRTLSPADVLLMVRKNPSIQQRLEEYCQQHCQPKPATKKRKSNNTDTLPVEQQQQQPRNRLLHAETSSSDEEPSPTAPRKRPAPSKTKSLKNSSKTATKKKDSSSAGYPEIRLPPVEDSSSSSSDDEQSKNTTTPRKPSASKSKSASSRPASRSRLLLDDSDDDSVLPEVVPHKPQTLRVLESSSDDDDDDKATGTGRASYKQHQSQVMQIMANLSPDSPPCGMEDGGTGICMEREPEEDHDGNVKARVRGQARPLILDLSSDEEELL
jgi:centromere protein S